MAEASSAFKRARVERGLDDCCSIDGASDAPGASLDIFPVRSVAWLRAHTEHRGSAGQAVQAGLPMRLFNDVGSPQTCQDARAARTLRDAANLGLPGWLSVSTTADDERLRLEAQLDMSNIWVLPFVPYSITTLHT